MHWSLCRDNDNTEVMCILLYSRNVYSLALHTTEIVNAVFNLNKILLAFQSVCLNLILKGTLGKKNIDEQKFEIRAHK